MADIAQSRDQFRALFAEHEPKIFKFVDEAVTAFGREHIKNMSIYCPLDAYELNDQSYGESRAW